MNNIKMDSAEIRFQRVYDEYQKKIFRYMVRMAGENEAEDLTQEVFVKIGLALETFRDESSLSTWIYRIATNAALDKLRRSANQHADEKLLPVERITESKEDENIWTGESADSINKLPEAYQSVIVLSELEDLSDREIADILGLTLQAMKIRLHRARVMLKKELTAACIFYRDDRQEFACDRKNPGSD
jgi:RNA polymerase sigma-70 factor (ECF subfamily)